MKNVTDYDISLAARKRSPDCPIYEEIKHQATQKMNLLEAQLHRPGQEKSIFVLRSPQTKFDECVYTELQRMVDAKGIPVRLMGI